MSVLTIWQNFYVIVGTASATLTGLTFVSVTLIAGTQRRRDNVAFQAYGTPTVVHFCVALLIAALFAAPWPALWNIALLLGLIGLGGICYLFVILRRMRRPTDYTPVLEDWLWHLILPFIAYIALLFASVTLLSGSELPLFIVGTVTVLFLFIGIHNSWDTVTYIAVEIVGQDREKQDAS